MICRTTAIHLILLHDLLHDQSVTVFDVIRTSSARIPLGSRNARLRTEDELVSGSSGTWDLASGIFVITLKKKQEL